MNFIWFLIIVLSLITSMLSGNTNLISNTILNSPVEAVSLCLKLMGNMCFWLGIMRIAEKAKIVENISSLFRPIIKRIFPEVHPEHQAFNAISLSLIANMIGIGNAATAFGIKAMKELQQLNPVKSEASHSMCMFIIVNSFMIQLIHTNTLFIRSLSGSENPAGVMPYITLATFLSVICGILITRMYQKYYMKRKI